MRNTCTRTSLHSALGLLLIAILAACGAEQSSNDQTVAVNLSLVFNSQQAHYQSAASRLLAFIQRWIPNPASAQAQSVTDIATIQVQISGPGIPTPPTASVPVPNPTSGQDIPVSIQAPVGPNRTITVAALNGAGLKIFGGTLPNVTLAPGPPINLTITLKRMFTVTVKKQGAGFGTVASSPAGINCGVSCLEQSSQFEENTTVVLSAEPASGSAFLGWSGGGCTG